MNGPRNNHLQAAMADRTVLVIDDNEAVRTAFDVLLSLFGVRVLGAATPPEGLAVLKNETVDLVIQDMNFRREATQGEEGVALFKEIRRREPELPIVLLTAWTHLETAVELVKAGAADYVAKPWDDARIVTTVRNLLQLRSAVAEAQAIKHTRAEARARLARAHRLCGIVYESEALHSLLSTATHIARANVPVLITGPNGSGKEIIADILHANGTCSEGPMVKVNVGALPNELMESELFGAEAGAFTGARSRTGRFEAAQGGTLFLDEIGNLSLTGQAKLLRVLQTGEFERLGSSVTRHVNVRVISATNADLRAAIAAGRFREDLYFRLNVIELKVPALAQRKDDILPLARHFLAEDFHLDASAQRALLAHAWPGNVRELMNAIRRACLLAPQPVVSAADLGLSPYSGAEQPEPDRDEIAAALSQAQGVVARAARSLGLSRQALYRRMEKLGLKE